jgi:hypothetical protein
MTNIVLGLIMILTGFGLLGYIVSEITKDSKTAKDIDQWDY